MQQLQTKNNKQYQLMYGDIAIHVHFIQYLIILVFHEFAQTDIWIGLYFIGTVWYRFGHPVLLSILMKGYSVGMVQVLQSCPDINVIKRTQ